MPKLTTKSGRPIIRPTDEEDAAIQRGIDADPDNPEWTAEDFAKARPFPELLAERRTDYRVEWSTDDNQYVGLCGGFPSLSWLDDTPETAEAGIKRIVAEAITDLLRNKETIPPSHS
jgi:predicted RNase H-like HicB family nuclease